eukprot:6935041-Prorocentrum_lima.AAC.1
MYCFHHGTLLKRQGTHKPLLAIRALWTGQKERCLQWQWENEQVLGEFIAMARAVSAEKVGDAGA